ncbi:response regulator [Thalassospira sp. MA62]|nr:response regulator [Thalassospira sp. MA62]
MPENASIIFVDDDQNVLNGLRRRLRIKRPKWTMRFFPSAEEALAALDKTPADVVISDMRMPNMDGAEFLRIVSHRFPQMARILLSGYADEISIRNSTSITHHFLSKPAGDVEIIHAIERGMILRRYLHDPILTKILDRAPDDVIWSPIFRHLNSLLQGRERDTTAGLSAFVRDHPVFYELIHQMGRHEDLVKPSEAHTFSEMIDLLGSESIKAICAIWAQLPDQIRLNPDAALSALERPLILGQLAAHIARHSARSDMEIDQIRAAALLCHNGEVVLERLAPLQFAASRTRADSDPCDIISAEIAEIGVAHPAVSALICAVWGFPHEIIENVAFHHRPESAPTGTSNSLLIVYAAQYFARKLGRHRTERAEKYDLAVSYIRKCNAQMLWPTWEKLCRDCAPI